MRVGIVHYLLDVKGGGERVCLYLTEHLQQRGHEVAIATGTQPGPRAFEFFQKFGNYYIGHGVPLPFGLYRNMLNFTDALYRMVKDFKPEIVVFTQASSIVQLRLLKLMNTPALLYCHWPGQISIRQRGRYVALGNEYYSDESGEPFFLYRRLPLARVFYITPYSILLRWAGQTFDSVQIVANSQFTRKAVEKLWEVKPNHVVYPPVDTSYFSPDFEAKNGKEFILMVARYSDGKGHPEALEIMQRLKKSNSDAKLVMVGSLTPRYHRYFRDMQETIDKYGLRSNVDVRVDIPEEQLLTLYRQASMLLHPIGTEHFGISIVEAMGCGTPVIGRRGGGLIEIVEDGKTGLLFHDLDDAAKKIAGLLADPGRRKEMGFAAYKRSKLFDKEVFKQQMESIIVKETR